MLLFDFKVGLVNMFLWEVVELKNGCVMFISLVNVILNCYEEVIYEDLCWMVGKIVDIDSLVFWYMVCKVYWLKFVEEFYFYKFVFCCVLILEVFGVVDFYLIFFDKYLDYYENGKFIIENGILLEDYLVEVYLESFIDIYGRFRNYGY